MKFEVTLVGPGMKIKEVIEAKDLLELFGLSYKLLVKLKEIGLDGFNGASMKEVNEG